MAKGNTNVPLPKLNGGSDWNGQMDKAEERQLTQHVDNQGNMQVQHRKVDIHRSTCISSLRQHLCRHFDRGLDLAMDLPYEHNELEDSYTHIRLLRHTRKSEYAILNFEIRAWPLKDCPAFRAISYCWGDPYLAAEILVNEKSFRISANAHYALLQATDQQKEKVDHYWIDAVCINQRDLHEKGHQVREMASVYNRASLVLCCIGNPQPSTDASLLFSVVEAYFPHEPFDQLQEAEQPVNKLGRYAETLPPGSEDLDRLCTAMERFLDNRYITRLWVVQEVLCASEQPFVLWGRGDIPAVTWWQLQDIVKAMHRLKLISTDHIPPFLALGLQMDRRVRQHGEMDVLKMTWSLPAIVATSRAFECSDIKDRIYAVTALVRWPPGLPPLEIDYNLKVEQLFVKVLPYYIAEHGELVCESLNILSQRLGIELTERQYKKLVGVHCLECAERYSQVPGRETNCRTPHVFEDTATTHGGSFSGASDHLCVCLESCPTPWSAGITGLNNETRAHLLGYGTLPAEWKPSNTLRDHDPE